VKRKKSDPKTLIVIPARGGSKGIPRKNLRPLNGRPLIWYAIQAALASDLADRVAVSTDDEEIQLFADRFGAAVLMRPRELALDSVPLDPVVRHAVQSCEDRWQEHYDIIVTVQPTSPLLEKKDIDAVIMQLKDGPVDTVLSVCEDRHLRWKQSNGRFEPAYEQRVNRQYLPEEYRETGAVIACRRHVLETGTRIGNAVGLHVMDSQRSIDVDTCHDLWLCEQILKRKRIVMAVTGNATVGMGHVYRCLMLAHALIHHEVIFVCRKQDDLAIDYISQHHYRVEVSEAANFFAFVRSLSPHLVINDILDTRADDMMVLKKSGARVVNFEDMGMGAEIADLVFNALYPHHMPRDHIVTGPSCFCLRDEFIHIDKKKRSGPVKRILLTFGGVDEGNLTCRVLKIIQEGLEKDGLHVDVVLGPGYTHLPALEKLAETLDPGWITIVRSTRKISEYMNSADLAVTSAGRTVFELASLEVPTLVICQNSREVTHRFASSENGIINLGLRTQIDDPAIARTLVQVVKEEALRKTMVEKMKALDLRSGKDRVIEKINALLH
jgi:CMP-N-acetylneuraminic acid synthetase/spore coat polysaccharide biosynthesis predicted glycosyltransferase SpsG